jgi:hypothetical protein
MTTRKKIIFGFATFYLVCGLTVSSLLAYALPATSISGRLYLIVIWPAMVSAGSFHTPTPPIPAWCFSFSGGKELDQWIPFAGLMLGMAIFLVLLFTGKIKIGNGLRIRSK